MSEMNILRNIINPFSPYFLCNHFIGNEIHEYNVNIPDDKHDILKTNNLSLINNNDIIQVQFGFFDFFINNILPKLGNKRIILITSQWHVSNFIQNKITDDLLDNPSIILWISQNPIYLNKEKYIPFPYGIAHYNLRHYIKVLFDLNDNIVKTDNIKHLGCNKYAHECRSILPNMWFTDTPIFYENIAKTKYVLSPIGDRDDCYRHYECIGLGAIPISNINENHKPIFENNMYYCSMDEMIEILNNNEIDHDYFIPNKNLISFEYNSILIKKIISLSLSQ